MRITAFIFFFLTLTFKLSAQTLEERYGHIKEDFLGKTYFGVTAGVAVPIMEYGATDPSKITSGYAKTGFTYNFTFRYAFTEYFGIAAKYFSTSNSFDSQQLQDDYNNYITPITKNKYLFTSDPYSLNGFMIVPTYLYKSPKYNIEIGVGIGRVASTLPQNSLTEIYPTDSVNIFSHDAYQSSNWALSVEGAFRYMVAKNVILSVQGDVLITDQTYNNIYTYLTNNTGNYYFTTPTSYLQPFRIVHLTAGIGFQLD